MCTPHQKCSSRPTPRSPLSAFSAPPHACHLLGTVLWIGSVLLPFALSGILKTKLPLLCPGFPTPVPTPTPRQPALTFSVKGSAENARAYVRDSVGADGLGNSDTRLRHARRHSPRARAPGTRSGTRGGIESSMRRWLWGGRERGAGRGARKSQQENRRKPFRAVRV